MIRKKIERGFGLAMVRILGPFKPKLGTRLSIFWYRRWGMNIAEEPNYISSRSWFDGSDYSRISIGVGATISSEVSVLTHDWALHTVGRSVGYKRSSPLGRHMNVTIGDYAFIGRGAILMPGANVGKGTIVGAGSVVRGDTGEYSIVVGNPSSVVGSSIDYFKKYNDV